MFIMTKFTQIRRCFWLYDYIRLCTSHNAPIEFNQQKVSISDDVFLIFDDIAETNKVLAIYNSFLKDQKSKGLLENEIVNLVNSCYKILRDNKNVRTLEPEDKDNFLKDLFEFYNNYLKTTENPLNKILY